MKRHTRKTYRIQVDTSLKKTDCEVCQAPQNIDVQAGFQPQTDTVSHFDLRQNLRIYIHPKTISDIYTSDCAKSLFMYCFKISYAKIYVNLNSLIQITNIY